MRYKPGDKVKVRSYEDMFKEFGLDKDGDIYIDDNIAFTSEMYKYCGKVITIDSIEGCTYKAKGNDKKCLYHWTDAMFEDYVPENDNDSKTLKIMNTRHSVPLSAYEIITILNWYESSVGITISDSIYSESKELSNRLDEISDSIIKGDYNAEDISREKREI